MNACSEHCLVLAECYPQFGMTSDTFEYILIRDDTRVIEHRKDGELLGFAVTEKNAVRLICVSPKARCRGIGRELMSRAEAQIRAEGFTEALTGGVSSKFLIGADKNSWGFFEKLGYTEVGSCDEMLLRLDGYTFSEENFRGHKTAEYGFYHGDVQTLREAVAKVDEDWVQYFDGDSRVYCAMSGGELASFCLVSTDVRNYLSDAYGRVGMPGCVGTVPKFRNKGIAIEMIARVTQILKEEGQDISFIFFTGVADWYRKLGYEVFMTEIFGKKEI